MSVRSEGPASRFSQKSHSQRRSQNPLVEGTQWNTAWASSGCGHGKGFGPQEIQEGKRAEIKLERETNQGDEAQEP